jgi:hypothetical protein
MSQYLLSQPPAHLLEVNTATRQPRRRREPGRAWPRIAQFARIDSRNLRDSLPSTASREPVAPDRRTGVCAA